MTEDEGDRLASALRAVSAARLVALGIPAVAAGRWCDAWRSEARRRGLDPGAATWEEGIRWIVAKVAAGERPPG